MKTKILSLVAGWILILSLLTVSFAYDFESVKAVEPSTSTVAASASVNTTVSANSTSANSTLSVSSGVVSDDFSEVSPSEQVVRIGKDDGELEIILRDSNGKPIFGDVLTLISSRDSDIMPSAKMTDENGVAVFNVNSKTPGVSTYSIFDLTKNKVLTSRAKIVYFNSTDEIFNTTSSNSYATQRSYSPYSASVLNSQNAVIGHAVGNSAGPVSHLAFKDLPQTVSVGQNISFTLSAMDQSEQIAMEYDGTVHFAVTSGDATSVNLPSDYTFGIQDAGAHTFSLALSFNSPGTYVIEARDIIDIQIFGTLTVVVSGTSGSASDLITLSNPVPGIFANKTQVVSGVATPGAKLKIYDNNSEIGSATADSTGNFMFVTAAMSDGDHEIFVAIINDGGTIVASSSKIKFKIDTTPPTFEKLEYVPAGVAASGEVEARVYAETNLLKVLLQVGDGTYEMKDSGNGYYSAKFKAPVTAGQYLSVVTLSDNLGNQTKKEKETPLLVGVQGTPGLSDVPGATSAPLVGDVANLIAYPGDHKVALKWDAPKTGNPVKFYRVFYGIAPNDMRYAVDTWTAATNWYIPDLINGKTYYFAVVAVDNEGGISSHVSNVVTGIPGSSTYLPPDVLEGTAGAEHLAEIPKDVSESGPEVAFLFAVAGLGGIAFSQFSKKK